MRGNLSKIILIFLIILLVAIINLSSQEIKTKKILSILENEEDENYIFYRVTGFAIDEKENIYILDAGNGRIQKYNKNGKYIKTISQKGEGPEELFFPISIKILNNKIFVYDLRTRRIIKFNLDGKLIDSFRVEEFFDLIEFDNQENIYCMKSKYEGDTGYSILSKYDPKGNFKINISDKIPFPFLATKEKRRQTKGGIFTGIALVPLFGSHILFTLDKNNNIYIGYPYNSYEIIKYSSNGKKLLTIKRKFKRIKVKKEDKKFLLEKFKNSTITQFPNYKPFFKSLNTDDKNNIWVETYEGENKREIHFHIFSQEGKYLNKAIIKTEDGRIHHKIRIKKDNIYILFYSPEKGLRLEKYKIL
ncbi:6-bladed beta-propeller [Candidatus Aminicenantes bacterium AH-873-B07]|nr:6-bladed beta-propeller [Candidatus Aminicenantes bacterium AH-873-B07]